MKKRRNNRRISMLFIIPALLALLVGACRPADPPAISPGASSTAVEQKVSTGITRPEIGFASPQKLQDHYEKHGREFGVITREEYLHLAQKLRDGPAGGPVLEAVRPDGTITRYHRETGAFLAFRQDGTIRTFFKPADGERYFYRQLKRIHR